MKIHFVSDLHLEFWKPDHMRFVDSIPAIGDVLVLAGDILTFASFSEEKIAEIFDRFAEKAKTVLYLPGNHEYYGQTITKTQKVIDKIVSRYCKLLVPGNVFEIDGRRFLGSALWFPFQAGNSRHEGCVADFGHILDADGLPFRKWVYEEHARHRTFLDENVREGDVVITHHLPSMESVPLRFKRTESNRFFVAPCEDLIEAAGPALWIHGHTHSVCDYKLGKTRVLCNPAGYPASPHTGYRGEMTEWKRDAVIEIAEKT